MLIFLDIDGVMVPSVAWKAPELMEDGFPMFGQKAIESLSSLLTAHTRVILTTSHRDRFTCQQWKKIFEARGLFISHLDKLPPNLGYSKRKDEIERWFASHETPQSFVIIDDDTSLYDLPKALKDHWVMTRSMLGLKPENLEDVLGIRQLP
jgi:hypothetical protein